MFRNVWTRPYYTFDELKWKVIFSWHAWEDLSSSKYTYVFIYMILNWWIYMNWKFCKNISIGIFFVRAEFYCILNSFKVVFHYLLSLIFVYRKLQHTNLVQLYGVCSKNRPIFIVTEYMRYGSLLNHLRRHEQSLSNNQGLLLDMCIQVIEFCNWVNFSTQKPSD